MHNIMHYNYWMIQVHNGSTSGPKSDIVFHKTTNEQLINMAIITSLSPVTTVFSHPLQFPLYYHIVVTIPAELPQNSPYSSGNYHGYRSITTFPIIVSLSNPHLSPVKFVLSSFHSFCTEVNSQNIDSAVTQKYVTGSKTVNWL